MSVNNGKVNFHWIKTYRELKAQHPHLINWE